MRWEEQGAATERGSPLRSERDPGRGRRENKTSKGASCRNSRLLAGPDALPALRFLLSLPEERPGWRGLKCLAGLPSPRLVAKARRKRPPSFSTHRDWILPLKISCIPGRCNSPVPKYSRRTTLLCKAECELLSFLLQDSGMIASRPGCSVPLGCTETSKTSSALGLKEIGTRKQNKI